MNRRKVKRGSFFDDKSVSKQLNEVFRQSFSLFAIIGVILLIFMMTITFTSKTVLIC